MRTNLFSDFNSVSAKEWKHKIQADLKGAEYESLLYHSDEGINVKPFYHAEDLQENYASATPDQWNICERFVINEDTKSATLLESIEKGAESLWLIISSEKINLETLLKEVDLENIPVFLDFDFLKPEILPQLKKLIADKKHQLTIGIDPVGHLAKTGNWHENYNSDFEQLQPFLELQQEIPVIFSINTALYQNAGANLVQQLAYSLAHINEYLNYLSENFPEKIKTFKPLFKVSVGSNYFFEIAKLKALRNLYASLASAYDMPEEIKILAFPTRRNKTLYDFNVNLLRTTTESMSGILGGADEVCNLPYDEIYHHDNDFGRRIARNQLLILKNESYFAKVSNMTDGTYYIESLTEQLAQKALEVFKSIEKGAGFLTELKEGTLQRKIKESADKEQEKFKNGEKILVGTNKYKNPEDKMKQDIEVDPFLERNVRKTLLQPIITRRLSENSEKERLKTE